MQSVNKFTFLMKGEPKRARKITRHSPWIVDEGKYLSVSELDKVMIAANELKRHGIHNRQFAHVRHWFMIALALNTGLRVSEMASLRHKNLLIDQERSSIIVLGKGNKKRLIWISQKFIKTCQDFIAFKTSYGYETTPDSPLLNNLNGDQISKRSLQKDFKAIIAMAGISSHYSIHCLRHTYATFLLKASNNNYRFVQNQLGHASIRTTQVYAGVLETEGRKAIEKIYT
ncbi:MAG: tyrosine-type recombinase/integrase [Candidatus Zixiibacteriota bacterium]